MPEILENKNLILFIFSIIISNFSISPIRRIGLKYGVIDRYEKRKDFKGTIVRIGGLSILIGSSISLLLIANLFNIQFDNHFINTNNVNNIDSNKINNTGIIPSKRLRWWIDVPVLLLDKSTIWIKMLADSGADKPCMNLYWAYKHFRDYIVIDNKPTTLSTPNGKLLQSIVYIYRFQEMIVLHTKQNFFF